MADSASASISARSSASAANTRDVAPPRAATAWLALIGVTAVLMLVELYLIFVFAPVEARMGIVQKIFYFHAPSAYAMYIGFGVSAIASAVYLAKRDERWDAWAVAGAEVGAMFCLIMLATGPLWGRKAWGTYWTWDPRLTTTLLAGMVYFAYIVLRSFGSTGEVEKRFAAGLSIFGLLDLPVIHYSVQRWRGTHPTVITGKGGGLHPDMYPPLFLGFLLFTLIAVLLMWQRARLERMRQRVLAIEIDAAERGLLEEG
jgi:heme exporter protein C